MSFVFFWIVFCVFEWPGDCVDKAWGTTGHVPEMEGSTAAWWTRWKMRTVATWFHGDNARIAG